MADHFPPASIKALKLLRDPAKFMLYYVIHSHFTTVEDVTVQLWHWLKFFEI